MAAGMAGNPPALGEPRKGATPTLDAVTISPLIRRRTMLGFICDGSSGSVLKRSITFAIVVPNKRLVEYLEVRHRPRLVEL